jgi:hypothetical protein
LIAPLQVATWLFVAGFGVWATSTIANRKSQIANYLRRAAPALLLFSIAMFLVLLPWMIRNYSVFNAVVPVCTSGGLVLYSANNPDSNGLYSEIPDIADITTPPEMLKHSKWCSNQAKTWMREEPFDFMALAAIKFVHTWGSEATFADLINLRGATNPLIKNGFSAFTLTGWSMLVLLWLAASGRLIVKAIPLTSLEILTGVIVLSNAVVYLVFEGGDRHHLPLIPLIISMYFDAGRSAK